MVMVDRRDLWGNAVVVIALAALAILAETVPSLPPAMSKEDAEAVCRPKSPKEQEFAMCVAMARMTPEQRQAVVDSLRKALWGDAESWAAEKVEVGQGWEISATTADVVLLTKAASGPVKPPKVWLRAEYRVGKSVGAETIYSTLQLEEFDCVGARSRTVQLSIWAQSNMRGDAERVPVSGDWTYPLPSSVSEGMMTRACEAATAAQ